MFVINTSQQSNQKPYVSTYEYGLPMGYYAWFPGNGNTVSTTYCGISAYVEAPVYADAYWKGPDGAALLCSSCTLPYDCGCGMTTKTLNINYIGATYWKGGECLGERICFSSYAHMCVNAFGKMCGDCSFLRARLGYISNTGVITDIIDCKCYFTGITGNQGTYSKIMQIDTSCPRTMPEGARLLYRLNFTVCDCHNTTSCPSNASVRPNFGSNVTVCAATLSKRACPFLISMK